MKVSNSFRKLPSANYHPDIYMKAVKRHQKYANHHGYIALIPSKAESTVGRKYAYICNGDGLMYKYLIKEDKLIFLDGTTF